MALTLTQEADLLALLAAFNAGEADENRYVVEIEDGTIEPQQKAFYPALETTTGRDRTQMKYKHADGSVSTLITVEEVQDLLAAGFAQALSSANLFVSVSSADELKFVAELEPA